MTTTRTATSIRASRPTRSEPTGGSWEELGPSLGTAAPPAVAANLRKVLATLGERKPTPPSHLRRWRLRLFCGHTTEHTAHRDHKTIGAAFTLMRCEVCGLDPATVVAAEPLGLVEPAPSAARPPDDTAKRRRLEAKLERSRAEVARLERELDDLHPDFLPTRSPESPQCD